jgi:hypothetical protein
MFSVAMDIYEMKTYADADKQAEPVLFKRVEREVSMKWANLSAKAAALGTSKVKS